MSRNLSIDKNREQPTTIRYIKKIRQSFTLKMRINIVKSSYAIEIFNQPTIANDRGVHGSDIRAYFGRFIPKKYTYGRRTFTF